jgi:hypothetical protein
VRVFGALVVVNNVVIGAVDVNTAVVVDNRYVVV